MLVSLLEIYINVSIQKEFCAAPAHIRESRALQTVKKLVILCYRSNGAQGQFIKYPAYRKDDDCEGNFPGSRGVGPPPDQRQCQRAYGAEDQDDEGGLKVPLALVFFASRAKRGVEKLAAVLALYGGILYLFSAIWALFHDEILYRDVCI